MTGKLDRNNNSVVEKSTKDESDVKVKEEEKFLVKVRSLVKWQMKEVNL